MQRSNFQLLDIQTHGKWSERPLAKSCQEDMLCVNHTQTRSYLATFQARRHCMCPSSTSSILLQMPSMACPPDQQQHIRTQPSQSSQGSMQLSAIPPSQSEQQQQLHPAVHSISQRHPQPGSPSSASTSALRPAQQCTVH